MLFEGIDVLRRFLILELSFVLIFNLYFFFIGVNIVLLLGIIVLLLLLLLLKLLLYLEVLFRLSVMLFFEVFFCLFVLFGVGRDGFGLCILLEGRGFD